MDKKEAKVIREEGNKWIVTTEDVPGELWLFKDKVRGARMKGQLGVGSKVYVELYKKGEYYRISKVFPIEGVKQINSDFTFPKYAKKDENLYLKLFKQKRLFDSNYEFDNKYNLEFEKTEFDVDLVKGINNNHIEQITNLLGAERVYSNLMASPEWRLSLGLGSTSVYETGLTLHHIYGVPFIPASGIKGIVRSYVITEVYEDEFTALLQKDFCDVFGCNGEGEFGGDKRTLSSFYKKKAEKEVNENDSGHRRGKVLFFDAFPESTVSIEADIMNVHYKDWYGEGVPPADWQDPNPIPFLTVGHRTKFQFVIGVNRDEYLPLLETAKRWMRNALENYGLGAKTAVGYGYFSISTEGDVEDEAMEESSSTEFIPTEGDKYSGKPREGDSVFARVVKAGSTPELELWINDDVLRNSKIEVVKYRGGIPEEYTEKFIEVEINQTHGNKKKPRIARVRIINLKLGV